MKYLCDPHVIPTVVPRDIGQIESYAAFVAEYADWLHVDIDDGEFEMETTWPFRQPLQLEELDRFQSAVSVPKKISLEVHLMTLNPKELGERFARAGFRRITAHREAFTDDDSAREAMDAYRAAGAEEAGLAYKITTPLSAISSLVAACDFVHLMSIANIGSQGQAFDERALSRIEELHAEHPELMVSVDGGVTEATVEALVRAGANRLLVGHALSESEHPAKTYEHIRARAMKGCAPVESDSETVNT